MATEIEESISSYFPGVGLTSREMMVLKAVYEKGYTVSEVATSLGVSRQNVNQIKKRAIMKLKKVYT